MLAGKRIVDLSHTITPGTEEFRLELDTRFTEEWDQFASYRRQEGQWYVISEVTFNTHVGTHIEFPYHHFQRGMDAASYPLDQLVGEATVIDISSWGNNDKIEAHDLQRIAQGKICPGDIVYFYTGLDRYYRTPKQHYRPWYTPEAIEWLVSTQLSVMGVDTSGIEVRNPDGSPFYEQPNHEVLLGAGIALVEHLTNLDSLIDQRFTTYILPVKLAGAEAFPVRIVAVIESEDHATNQ